MADEMAGIMRSRFGGQRCMPSRRREGPSATKRYVSFAGFVVDGLN